MANASFSRAAPRYFSAPAAVAACAGPAAGNGFEAASAPPAPLPLPRLPCLPERSCRWTYPKLGLTIES